MVAALPAWKHLSRANSSASTTIFTEGFEGTFPAPGWTVNTSLSRKWDETAYTAHTGTQSAFCAEYAGNDASNTYVNRMTTYMQRSVSLANRVSANLSFYYKLNSEANYDFLQVRVNNTVVWRQSGQTADWTQANISLNNYAKKANVTIRIEFASDASVVPTGDAGAWVDDVVLTGDDGVVIDTDDQIAEAISLGDTSATRSATDSISVGSDVGHVRHHGGGRAEDRH